MSDAWTTTTSEPEWAAFAASDWADQKNFWRLLPAGSRRSEAGELENTPENGGGLGGGPTAAIWRRTDCGDCGRLSVASEESACSLHGFG